MRKPRLVASDLDGTLLKSDGTVSAGTSEVWSLLAEQGIKTVVVTARPPRWLDALGDLIGDHGTAICANGAFIYDARSREVVQKHGFSPTEALALVERILAAHPAAGVAYETERGMFRASSYSDAHAHLAMHSSGVVDCELDEVPTDVVVGKILVRDESWREDDFVDDLERLIGEGGQLAYSGAAGLAEISAPGITKAVRLKQWCDEQGIDASQVWAFGDMPNDIPMLSWAGRGIAVANAHDDLKAIADAECGGNDEDGVAHELLKLVERR